jgi:hypothetical protein
MYVTQKESTPEEDRLASKDGLLKTSDEGLLMIDVQVGDSVKAKHIPYFDLMFDDDCAHPAKDQVVVVKSIKWDIDPSGIGPKNEGGETISAVGAWFERTGGSTWMEFDRWEHVSRPNVGDPVDLAENPHGGNLSVYELTRQIHELQAQALRHRAYVKDLNLKFSDWELTTENALELISDTLNEEASERDFCSEWDQIVTSLNEQLPRTHQLTGRQREYAVSWTESYTINVERCETVIAANPDEAREQCEAMDNYEDCGDEMIKDAIDMRDPEHMDTCLMEVEES